MAYPRTRSMTADLAEGMSDGTYKKVDQDRGGVVEPATLRARADLYDIWHGIHETRAKVLGDGTIHVTPDFAPTSAPLVY